MHETYEIENYRVHQGSWGRKWEVRMKGKLWLVCKTKNLK